MALEVGGLDAVAVAPAVDTVLDCAEDRPVAEAVAIADSALRRRLVTVEDLVAGVALRAGQPKSRRLQKVLALVDPACESVLESLLRVLLLEHGLVPDSQQVLHARDGKTPIGRVDLAFLQQRLVIEADGRRWHDPEDARTKDRRRDNALARAGWLVLRFTWDEVRHSPAFVVAAVRDALLPVAA